MDFCPRCGDRGTRGALCAACAGAEQQIRFGKDITITICTTCHRSMTKNHWTAFTEPTAAVERAIRMSMPMLEKVEIDDTGIPVLSGPGIKKESTIRATLDGAAYELPARVVTTLCPQCSKRHTQYYEGILQLRNPHSLVVEFINAEVAKQTDKGIAISKAVPVEGGMDFYITSQRYVQLLGKKLKQHFGGTLKVNASIFTRSRQTSKDLYRVNVLYAPPAYAVDDVVDAGGVPILVRNLRNTPTGLNLATGKRCQLPRDVGDVLPQQKSRVLKVTPRIEVMDPATYQSMPIANAILPEVKNGEKVKVVSLNGKLYVR